MVSQNVDVIMRSFGCANLWSRHVDVFRHKTEKVTKLQTEVMWCKGNPDP